MVFFEIYGEQKTLTQWDLGRRMQVNLPCQQLHYANAGVTEAFVCPVQEEGGVRTARIPDEVLQVSGTLWVYAYVEAEEGYTKQVASFYVKARPQPADYVYTPTQWVKLEDVMARMDVLENKAEKDPTVPGWAKQQQKPVYSAQEVGARANTWLPSLAEIGAAPDGFGLGGSGQSGMAVLTPDTIDAAVHNGWYAYYDNAFTDLAGLSFAGGIFVVTRYVGVYQYFFPRWDAYGAGIYAVRNQKDDGSWSEWEIENPPMAEGVEYRTTERYEGQPVYTRLVNYGETTNGSVFSCPSCSKILRYAAVVSNWYVLPYTAGNSTASISYADKLEIGYTGTISGELKVQFWYV